MLGLGPDRAVFRGRVQRRLRVAGTHAARARHSRRLRPAQERDREAFRARAHGLARHGDDRLRSSLALLARIFVVFFAFVLACVAAAVVTTFALLLPGWNALSDRPLDQQGVAVMVGLSAAFFSIYAMLPAMLMIALTEGFRLRSVLFYALA